MLVAGTERGAFVSMNDGDSWQPLQLNLPVTSVRDFEIHGNDLIVGTHGRGIWVIDDISPLRQLDDAVLASDVHLFKPADVTTYTQGSDNGTPMQKDEPHAENPPEGVVIDYWLRRAARGPVTLEILDAAGKSLRLFSSEGAPPPAGRRRGPAPGGIARVSPLWQTTPEPFSAAAGLHRVAWNPEVEIGTSPDPMSDDGRPKRVALDGTFTAKLSAEGKSWTQSFVVRPDPRLRG
jgi:hypothetical protein